MPNTKPDDLKPEVRKAINACLAEIRKSFDITAQIRRTTSGKVKVTPTVAGKQMKGQIFEDDEHIAENICRYLNSVRKLAG